MGIGTTVVTTVALCTSCSRANNEKWELLYLILQKLFLIHWPYYKKYIFISTQCNRLSNHVSK